MNFKIGDIVDFQSFKNATVASGLIKIDFGTTGILLCVNSSPGWEVSDMIGDRPKMANVAKSYVEHKPSNKYWFVISDLMDRIKPVQVTEQRFKNGVAVTGPIHLINAFADTAKEIGWNLTVDGNTSNSPGLYFNAKKIHGPSDLQPQHFWYTNQGSGFDVPRYKLPQQWDESVAAISEKEVVIVEKPIEISGYVAEVKRNTIAFGCQQFTVP